ncbi:MAG TPA: peptidylprolyl isomerase, partial [Rhodothermales bacterium]
MKLEPLPNSFAPLSESYGAEPNSFRSVRSWVLAAFLFLSTSALAAPRPPVDASDSVVARVAAGEIRVEGFRAQYAEYLVRTGLSDSGALRSHFLDGLIETRLLAEEALANGIERRPDYAFARERFLRKLLVDLYVRRTLYEPIVVTEADLDEAFARINTTLETRHLYARTLAEAEALRARLDAGESWEQLAAETFADSALAASGGHLGRFTFDEMDADFEDAAFALEVGEISEPIRTAQGYSIIQLLGREVKPLMTEYEFAAKRSMLQAFVTNRKRAAAQRAHARALADALELSFDETSLNDLLGQVSGTVVATDDESYEAWLARPLLHFTVDGERRSWSIARFRNEAQYTDEAQRAQVRSLQDLTEFAEGVVVREVMLERARERGLDADPTLAAALDAAMT